MWPHLKLGISKYIGVILCTKYNGTSVRRFPSSRDSNVLDLDGHVLAAKTGMPAQNASTRWRCGAHALHCIVPKFVRVGFNFDVCFVSGFPDLFGLELHNRHPTPQI